LVRPEGCHAPVIIRPNRLNRLAIFLPLLQTLLPNGIYTGYVQVFRLKTEG
jgi:hypothetical protein